MRNHARPFLLLCLIGIMGLFVVACNKSSNSIDADGNPLASVQDNARQATPEELQRLMPPEFFVDPDGDGSIGTNSLWLSAQTNLFASVPRPSLRANVGAGKTILFYTKQNTQWLNFTSDLRQLLADNGYTVLVHNANSDLPDLTNVDVLAIIHSIWAPGSPSNQMPKDDKDKIKNFVASGKGFFYSGDWLKSELPQFNDIAGIFNVKMSLQEVDYILTGFPPPTTIYVPTWSAYVFDWINYYSAYPSQPIMKKAPVFGKMAFSNETHEIFKDVDQVLFLGSSFIKPHVPALAGIGTHPTTSRPRGAYPYDESFQMVVANEHVAGRYVISCDSNCFANDGFAKSDLANTDNKIFAMNVFNWLAQNSSEPEIDEIKIKDLESGLFVSSLEMSSIKGIKNFQAIGFKNGEEGDPVPVTWSFSGGDVTTDSMRAKILTKLDVNVGKIGIFETSTGAQKEVHDATQVKFVSYLSSTLTGNIIIIANEDTVPQKEVSIRLKQPKFDVKVWPVDSVDTGLFTPWQTVVTEVWNRESILHVGTFELGSQIDNILAPNPPLVPLTIPYAEPLLPEKGWGSPSFMNPIVYDSKLVETFGANIVPRQPYELFSESRNIGEINVYLVEAPLQYSLVPTFPIPQMGFLPHTAWTIDSNGAKDFAVKGAFLDDSLKSGICVKRITPPYTDEFKRILAHEIGHTLIQTGDEHDLSNITPPAAREENLMEGGGIAKGLKLAPEQYISILNLDGQKTNSAIFIREE